MERKNPDTNKIHIVLGVIVLPIGIYSLANSFFTEDMIDFMVLFVAGWMVTAFGIILIISGLKKMD